MAATLLRLLRFLAVLCGLAATGGAACAQPLEVAVKAAFLPKFAPYVTGPASDADAPYAICIVGRDPFGALIEDATSGQRIGNRPLVVRRLAKIDRHTPCHMAFLSGSPAQSVDDALDLLRGAPVLTVTDARQSRARGMIHFEVSGDRVRFHVDDTAAAQSGLDVSSKLLKLALSVRPRGRR